MTETNILTARIGANRKARLEAVFQWDKGWKLRFLGDLPDQYKAVISHHGDATGQEIDVDGDTVDIPDELLEQDGQIDVHLYWYSETAGHTFAVVEIPVAPLPKPADRA